MATRCAMLNPLPMPFKSLAILFNSLTGWAKVDMDIPFCG
jgi:hypothetical protein